MPRIDTRLEKLERTALGPVEHVAVDFTTAEAAAWSDEQRLAILGEAKRRAGEHGRVIVLTWNLDLADDGDRVVRLRWPEDD